MGVGELLGVKIEKLNVKTCATLQDLYEKIKDVEFEAGKPSLVKHGLNTVIVFPQFDRNNQIWICDLGKGKFQVQRSTIIAGLGNMVTNMVIDDLTDGLTTIPAGLGKTKKMCMEQVTRVADTINAMAI